MSVQEELIRIAARYERRKERGQDDRTDLTLPHRHRAHQEKERTYLRLFSRWSREERAKMRVLEVGCGFGDNLLQFLSWGFSAENLVGNELLEDRCEAARRTLPSAVRVLPGDACQLDFEDESFDIVLQSTVFTSILDDAFQEQLARRMWSLVTPRGGVLWYDFAFKNPNNQDVRGVKLRRVRELFPAANLSCERITLAPPIARCVTKIHPALYNTLSFFPFLRSHLFCWLEKKQA